MIEALSGSLKWGVLIHNLLIVLGFVSVLFALTQANILRQKNKTTLALFLFGLLFVYLMGWYPLGFGTGNDRDNYAHVFLKLKYFGLSVSDYEDEPVFRYITYWISRFADISTYFVLIAAIYVANYCVAISRIVKYNSVWLLLAVALSMGFVSYNTNTTRAGLAISFMILGLSMYPKRLSVLLLFVVASLTHKSVAIPCTMLVLGYFLKGKPNKVYVLWFLSIFVSLVAGSYFNVLFSGMADDSRTSYLTDQQTHYNTGFRVDFILYSLVPIFIGWYYMFRIKFKSDFYRILYNGFVLTNIFWILVIRANFSDRFAYLSWCMIPFVLVYPLLINPRLFSNPNNWIASILLGETLFLMVI